jgi:hypothetical protein
MSIVSAEERLKDRNVVVCKGLKNVACKTIAGFDREERRAF